MKQILGFTDDFVKEAKKRLEKSQEDSHNRVGLDMDVVQWNRLRCLIETLLAEAQSKVQEASETEQVLSALYDAVTYPQVIR
jgi:hypothetical protein